MPDFAAGLGGFIDTSSLVRLSPFGLEPESPGLCEIKGSAPRCVLDESESGELEHDRLDGRWRPVTEQQPDVAPRWTFARGFSGLSDGVESNGDRDRWKFSSSVVELAQSPAPFVEARLRNSHSSFSLEPPPCLSRG